MADYGADASPASEVTEATALDAGSPAAETAQTPLDANAAESSDAGTTDANEAPKSLLDVVKSAVEKVTKAPEDSSTPEEAKQEAEAKPETDEPKADDADVPFHNHPRWKQIVAERDAAQADATEYGKITTFMEVNNLVATEVAEGFEIMALLKQGTPESIEKALEWFEPRTAMLREAVGRTLPADLQEKVDTGMIDADVAAELAQARAGQALRERHGEATAAAAAEAQQREAAQVTQRSMMDAVTAWEKRTAGADPDYAEKKASMVETTARAIIQRTGKAPASADEAVALVDQALNEVNASLKALIPKPRPITPAPTSMSARNSVVPKTLREAIEASLAG